jgi:hypothetical protein
MEEELCLVDSCTTNTILRELKYFQTLKKSKGNVTTIVGRDACDRTAQNSSVLSPKPVHVAIKQQ